MHKRPKSLRTALVLPLVLASVALIEEIATFVLRHRVDGALHRALVRLVLDGAVLSIAAAYVSPAIKRAITKAHGQSKRRIGALGPWLFYALAYVLVFYAYFVLETRGPGGFVPSALR